MPAALVAPLTSVRPALNCGLLGRKLSHSYSPAIHEAFGGYNYKLFEVEPPDIPAFMARDDFNGLNVTIPYKKTVLEYCRQLSPAASEIGSVNTMLRLPGGGFYGDNTDVSGFKKMLSQTGLAIPGKKVIVFGKGGSSLTVRHVMKELGAAEIVIVSRQDNNHEFLRHHKDAAILVNSTPVGMYPGNDETPVSLDYFPCLEGVFDLVYNPARTRLLTEAKKRNLAHIGGLSMLVGQAAAASEIFTGKNVSEEKEQAVMRLLRRRMENIVLVGMPGCGKTTIGQMLAEKMDKRFVDTDAVIEQTAGCSIPEIFSREGEEGFRKRETEALKITGKESGLVIATGGGGVTREENYAHLHQNGSIIFMERSLDKLARKDRPLSQGSLEEMYENRQSLYRRFADRVVRNDGEVSATVEIIMEALDEVTGN